MRQNRLETSGLLYYPLQDADITDIAQWQMSGAISPEGLAVSSSSPYKDILAEYVCRFNYHRAIAGFLYNGDVDLLFEPEYYPEKRETPINHLQEEYASNSGNFKTTTSFPWDLTNSVFQTALEDNVAKIMAGRLTAKEFINEMIKANR